MKLATSFFLLAVLFPAQPEAAAAWHQIVKNDLEDPGYAPGELLITVRGRTGARGTEWTARSANTALNYIMDRLGAVQVRRLGIRKPQRSRGSGAQNKPGREIYRVLLQSGTSVKEAMMRIPPSEEIISVEPNLIYKCSVIPDDSLFTQQWALTKIEAPAAWNVERGDTSIVIGIIDTGVDYDHPDLAANIWTNWAEFNGLPGVDDDANGFVDDFRGYDFVTGTYVAPGEDPGPQDNDPMDFHGHGTHVSGIAAAVGNNGRGIAGVSWNSRLMALRAGYADVNGYGILLNSDIIDAVYYAVDNGADVLSMSFGGGESYAVSVALNDAYQADIVLVAAAGNAGTDSPTYPAALPYVIAVAATDSFDQRPAWSNYGSWVDVAAPGLDIISTLFNDTYYTWSGTSMAAPCAAGAAALLLSRHPEFTPDQVATVIRSASSPLTGTEFIGAGRLNVNLITGTNSIGTAKLDQKYDSTTLGPKQVTITGTAGGVSYSLYWGQGVYPVSWNLISSGGAVTRDVLGSFDTSALLQDGVYVFRLLVTDVMGEVGEDRWIFYFDGKLKNGWPKRIGYDWGISSAAADLDNDGVNEIIACSLDGYVHVWDHTATDKPGWPIKVSGSGVIFSTPAFADLDMDGDLEIILATTTGGIQAWHHNGSVVTGWPKTFPWPQRPWASVSIGNLDSDPEPEIVGSVIDPLALFVLNADGTVLPGWPLTYPEGWWSQSTSALVDLDGDGIDEIVFARWESGSNEQTAVEIISSYGTVLPGWPVFFPKGTLSSPTVCDLEGDGELEIIVVSGEQMRVLNTSGQVAAGWPFNTTASAYNASPNTGEVDGDGFFEIAFATICDEQYMLNHDGSVLPGWPVDPTQVCVITGALLPSSIFADIDGDSLNDIVTTSAARSRIWARDKNGTPLSGWPHRIGGTDMYGVLTNTAAVTDTDGNGDVEVICPGNDGFMYVWDLQAPFVQTEDGWYMLHHDLRNSRYLARKQVQLAEPNGAVMLDAGSVFTIRWISLAPHMVLDWDLWFSTSGPGGPWIEIASNLPGGADTTGSIHTYDWTVPDTASTEVRVKIRMDNAGADYFDISDANFEINAPTSVQLSSFHAERRGQKALISWVVASVENHKGFHVYRQPERAAMEQVSTQLISGSKHYEFEDEHAPAGRTFYWLKEIENDGSERWYGPASLPAAEPLEYPLAIRAVHPNPFNPSTTIEYSLPEAGLARIAVYDVRGRLIKTLLDGSRHAGSQSIDWNGRDEKDEEASSGVYFVLLEFDRRTRSRKLVLLK